MNFVKSMFRTNRIKLSSRHSEAYSLKNLSDSSGYLRMTALRVIRGFVFINLLFVSIGFALPVQAAAPTNGLVGYWNFDEGTGTTAGDSSGSGNTGINIYLNGVLNDGGLIQNCGGSSLE